MSSMFCAAPSAANSQKPPVTLQHLIKTGFFRFDMFASTPTSPGNFFSGHKCYLQTELQGFFVVSEIIPLESGAADPIRL